MRVNGINLVLITITKIGWGRIPPSPPILAFRIPSRRRRHQYLFDEYSDLTTYIIPVNHFKLSIMP